MDWRLFFTTFAAIFVAELGDKTQFAAMAASAQSRSTLTILIAVVTALSCAGALGVLGGRVLGEFIKPEVIRWLSGGLFVVIGLWILIGKK